MAGEMVERVAHALAKADLDEGDGTLDAYALTEEVYDRYLALARVAIAAIREADNDMLEAMHNAMFTNKFTGRELPMLGAGFEAAIDAALKD